MVDENGRINFQEIISRVAELSQWRIDFGREHEAVHRLLLEKVDDCKGMIDGCNVMVKQLQPNPSKYFAVLTTIFLAIIGGFTAYGQLSARVDEHEARLNHKRELIAAEDTKLNDLAQRLARAEEINKRLETVEKKIDRLADAVASRGKWAN